MLGSGGWGLPRLQDCYKPLCGMCSRGLEEMLPVPGRDSLATDALDQVGARCLRRHHHIKPPKAMERPGSPAQRSAHSAIRAVPHAITSEII